MAENDNWGGPLAKKEDTWGGPLAKKEEPSFLGTMEEAALKGLTEATKETAAVTDPYKYAPEVPKEPTETEKLLEKGMGEGWKDPRWWAAKAAYGTTKSYPTVGGGLIGGAAGTAVGGLPGAVVGGAGGAAVGAMVQTLAPAYQQARAEGLDHEAAVDRAWKDTYTSGAFGAVSGALPLFRLARGPISNFLAQMFVAQPGVGATQRATTKYMHEGELPSAEELGKGYAEDVGLGLAMTAPHAIAKVPSTIKERISQRPPPVPTPEEFAAQQMGVRFPKKIRPEDVESAYGQLQEKAQQIGADITPPGVSYPTERAAAESVQSELASASENYRRQIQNLESMISEESRQGGPEITQPVQLGEKLKQDIRSQAEAHRKEYEGLYKTAKEAEGGFNPTNFVGLGSRIKNFLPDLNVSNETPVTNKAIKYLDNLENFLKPNDKSLVDLQGLEQARIGLNDIYREAAASRTGSEIYNVKKIIETFDKHLDDAISTSLFTGDPQGLKAYKDARASYHRYMKTYTKQSGDPVSRNLARIVEHDPAPGEVAKYLINTRNLGETEGSVGTAKALKNILGQNSDSLKAVKYYAWKEISNLKDPKKIEQFANSSLGKELYSDDILAAMRTHAQGLRNAQQLFKNKDVQGRLGGVFDKILNNTAQPQEITNTVFGSLGKETSEPEFYRFVNAVKNITGPESSALDAIKMGVYRKLTSGTPKENVANIINFTNQAHSDLASSLFSPSELNKLRTYAKATEHIIQKEGEQAAKKPPTFISKIKEAIQEEYIPHLIGKGAGLILGPAGYVGGSIASRIAMKQLKKKASGGSVTEPFTGSSNPERMYDKDIEDFVTVEDKKKDESVTDKMVKARSKEKSDIPYLPNEGYLNAVKKFEGFTPKATWDIKQHSVGYGSKAKYPGEEITREEAEKRFREEMMDAGARVNKFKFDMPEPWKAALTSLTYNAGSAWMKSGLGDAVRKGDWNKARQIFLTYNKAEGKVNEGLKNRRIAEVEWLKKQPETQIAQGQAPAVLQGRPETDQVKLARMAAEAARSEPQPSSADQAAMTNLVRETATVPTPQSKTRTPAEMEKIAAFLKLLQEQEEAASPTPPPLAAPQAPKPEIPIVRPYGMASGGFIQEGAPDLPGGSVEDYLYNLEMEQGSPIQGSMSRNQADVSGSLGGSLGPLSGNIGGYAFKSGPMKGGDISNVSIQYNPDEDTTFGGEYYKEGDQGFGVMGRGSIRYAKGGSVTDKMKKAKQLSQACWEGYKAVGVKTKKGKTVPNCVPVKKKKNG